MVKNVLWVTLLLCCVLAHQSRALPRFSSRTGAKCQSCHLNPSGGMLRQTFGAQYGRDELPVPEWSGQSDDEDLSGILGKVLGIGADVRTIYFSRQIPDTGSVQGTSNRNAFWQMQGDIYLDFRATKRVHFFLNKGLYSGFEAFGLLSILPANGYVKIGKFLPNFGTRLDDHTAFIRTYTGFSPEQGRPELTGAEVGMSPGPLSLTGGFYNSSDGFGSSGTNAKAFLGRAEGLFALPGKVFLGIGGNVFSRANSTGGRSLLYGGFGSASIGGLTLIGEATFVRDGSGPSRVTRMVTYLEADYVLTQGVDLKVAYDFYDPDTDAKTGAISRYSVGVEFFPLPGVEVRPLYRIRKDEPVDLRNNEFDVMLHLYI